MIGHPYFFCQFNKTYAELNQSSNYYQTLINEPQIKLRPLQRYSLNRALQYLLDGYPLFTKEQIIYISIVFIICILIIVFSMPILLRLTEKGPCVALNNILSIV